MNKEQIVQLVNAKCQALKLDHSIILALIERESVFLPKVMRYETTYRWVYEVNKNAKRLSISQSTEMTLQKFSYGLLQIMGGVAREQGFTGYLPDLLDVETNLEFGLKKVLSVQKRYPDVRKWLSAYNAGSPTDRNKSYVDYILAQSVKYK